MNKRVVILFFLCILFASSFTYSGYASTFDVEVRTPDILIPELDLSIGGTNDPAEVVPALQVLFLVSIIALAPSILILFTCFTRIIIALHFIRSAMGTQQMPPNQVLIGLALILTLFMMAPQLREINDNALQPFGRGEIATEEAISRGIAPIERFMRAQIDDNDVALFVSLSGETYASAEDVPFEIIVPSFLLSELTQGFFIGFMIYLPFIVIDMVVASILMAMGMMMLPPAMISMPFKILVFLMMGGWNYCIEYILRTFVPV